jgi:hypothetical protein
LFGSPFTRKVMMIDILHLLGCGSRLYSNRLRVVDQVRFTAGAGDRSLLGLAAQHRVQPPA